MPDTRATVYLGNRQVGILVYQDGNTWFEYQDLEPEHPVLGQAFELDPNRRRTASGGVPEWFANLLPERESGLRRMILNDLGKSRIHDFALLAYLGEDLPGAVRVVADQQIFDSADWVESDHRTHDHPLRFSLAGVQPKFSMRHDGKALALPATGKGGDWIVKLPDRRFPHVPENEYSMLTWAKRSGIDIPEIDLVWGSDLQEIPRGLIAQDELALAVRRFDRRAEARIHQEDFAQIREVSVESKYERATYDGIGKVIQQLSPEDVQRICPSPGCDCCHGKPGCASKELDIGISGRTHSQVVTCLRLGSRSSLPRVRGGSTCLSIGEYTPCAFDQHKQLLSPCRNHGG